MIFTTRTGLAVHHDRDRDPAFIGAHDAISRGSSSARRCGLGLRGGGLIGLALALLTLLAAGPSGRASPRCSAESASGASIVPALWQWAAAGRCCRSRCGDSRHVDRAAHRAARARAHAMKLTRALAARSASRGHRRWLAWRASAGSLGRRPVHATDRGRSRPRTDADRRADRRQPARRDRAAACSPRARRRSSSSRASIAGVDVTATAAAPARQEPECVAVLHRARATPPTTRSATPLETAAWMREKDFHSLRLVTASYHMPRSLLEFSRAMPDVADRAATRSSPSRARRTLVAAAARLGAGRRRVHEISALALTRPADRPRAGAVILLRSLLFKLLFYLGDRGACGPRACRCCWRRGVHRRYFGHCWAAAGRCGSLELERRARLRGARARESARTGRRSSR